MDDEGHAPALPRAVQGDEADVGVRVLPPALSPTSRSTCAASVQPNMGSFHSVQYRPS